MAHELAHAQLFDSSPTSYISYKLTGIVLNHLLNWKYDDLEEWRVIELFENQAAGALKECQRHDHRLKRK